jgi:hypothetical protein
MAQKNVEMPVLKNIRTVDIFCQAKTVRIIVNIEKHYTLMYSMYLLQANSLFDTFTFIIVAAC